MKKKELEQFQKILLEEKKKILRQLEELSDESSGEDVNISSGDPADIASVEISQLGLQKIGKRFTSLLKKIDKALKKIDDKSYGECEECGEQIASARLKARPVAELCIDCKTVQENLERRFSHEERKSDDVFVDDDEDN